MSQPRKVVLQQFETLEPATGVTACYKVAELHNFVELNVGQMLTKREVEELIGRPRMTVIVKSPK